MVHPARGDSDELFFTTTNETPTSAAIQPLRINKQGRTPSPAQSNPLPYPVGRPSQTQSAAGPVNKLPYPDSRPVVGGRKDSLPNFDRRSSVEHRPPYPDSKPSFTTSSSPGPGRHVSVTHSDDYPTPPSFKHRESMRPARLGRTSSLPQTQPESPGPEPPLKDEPVSALSVDLNPFPNHREYGQPQRTVSTMSTSTTAARRGSPPPPLTPLTATEEAPPVRLGEAPSVPSASSRIPQQPKAQTQQSSFQRQRTSSQSQPKPQQVSYQQQQQTAQTPEPVRKPWTPTEAPNSHPFGPPTGFSYQQQQQTAQTPEPVRRPWTPTEAPNSHPFGPPTVYQGSTAVAQSPAASTPAVSAPRPSVKPPAQPDSSLPQPVHIHVLESDFQHLNMNDEPPPSYASLSQLGPAQIPATSSATTPQGYPNEKQTVVLATAAPAAPGENPHHQNHPAFHNENLRQQQQQQQPQTQVPVQAQFQSQTQFQSQAHIPTPTTSPVHTPVQIQTKSQIQTQAQPPQPQSQQSPQPQQPFQTQQQPLQPQQTQPFQAQQPQPFQAQQPQQPQPFQAQQPQPFQAQQSQPFQPQQPLQPQQLQPSATFPPQQQVPQQSLPQQQLPQGHVPGTPDPAIQQSQFTQQPLQFATPSPAIGPSAPPPLPEGWMSHLDPGSGQYYYIHIATQRTQWEFPVPEATSPPPPLATPAFPPPLTSPGMPPVGFQDLHLTPAIGTPVPLLHTGSFPIMPPPPTLPVAGVAMYNIQPSNGEYFGPYLRYTNMDIDRGIWLGSIMIVTADPVPPTVHLHQSIDLSPNPRQLKANPMYTYKAWTFYRYDIDIPMLDMPAKWTYAITSHMGCVRFEFLVASRWERNWRFIAHSCNDFSVSVNPAEKTRLGGVDFMWRDVLVKHAEIGGFHAQLGGGDQIYADRIWKELPLLKEWLAIRGKESRKTAPWTAKHEEDVQHAYFHYYTSHFDKPHIREAWAQIPHCLQVDDHDIFDGFGSYPEYMQYSNTFKNIGRIAFHWYLLFQHHTTLDILRVTPDERDLFTITGTGWHFIKYLGPTIAVVGVDTRSERNQHQVLSGPTYQGLFPRIANLPTSVQHVVMMLAVPIIYPRLEVAERVVETVATSKKAVTGTYNLLGKVVGSAAGVVGAKKVVGEGFDSVKKAFGKSGFMSSVVSVFGEVDLLDDLRDHWTHESKDLERTYLIRTLQGISHQRSMRVTFLSGDVHCCGAGLVHDPTTPLSHKTMYQIISSAIANVPPPNMVLKILHNHKILYIPQNGMRSTHTPSDTKEEMVELFQVDVNGQAREWKKLMGRRNYAIFTGFDALGAIPVNTPVQDIKQLPLSLAVEFVVQGEGPYATTVKYGPVVIPRVEYGQ